jgi:hypothetical protein
LVVGGLDSLDPLHNLYAPTVSLGSLSVVGDVETNTLQNNGAILGAQAPYPSTAMPPLPQAFPAQPGASNVTVAALQTQTLNPGSYGILSDNGKVLLNPGTYSFSGVTLGANAQLLAQPGGSTTVLIAGTLTTGTFAQVLPTAQAASQLTISVAGTDGAGGSPAAVTIGASTQITSLLAAPNGTLSLGNGVNATGAFAALNVVAGSGVLLTFQCGFPVETPTIGTFVAYAQRSVTLGIGDRSLGGDIGVAAATAATFGTQLIVGNLDGLDALHDLYAPSASLGVLSSVGDIEVQVLQNNGGSFFAQTPYPASAMPLLPLALPTAPGTTNVTVPSLTIQTLTPGNYGALTVNGTASLAPGAYSFASVSLGTSAHLWAQPGGPTSVAIAGTLAVGQSAQILPLGQTADQLLVSVAGNDGPGGSPVAASIGASSQVTCLLMVPHGTLSLGANVQATGAFAGFDINASSNVTLTFQTGFPPVSQQPQGQQQLSGYITPMMAAAPLVGPVPQSTMMMLAIALPVQVPQAGPYSGITLAALAQQVSDPSNPSYRNYLTPAQTVATYSPTVADYTTLTNFATANGLSAVTYANRILLDVTGTAGQIGQMLFTNFNYYSRPDGSTFFAPDREPSTALTLPLLRVAGLDNAILPTYGGTPGSGPKGEFIGNDFRNIYLPDCVTSGLSGAGQSIGLLELEGNNPNDIEAYAALAGISPTITTVTFTSTFASSLNDDGNQEAPLDIEVAMSMAPRAQIVVYQAPEGHTFGDNFTDDILNAMAYPATVGAPFSNQLSSSWRASLDSSGQQSLNIMAAQGQSFFQSSGDSGSFTQNPTDIRIAANITLVGGTQVLTFGSTQRPQETVWANSAFASGGGFFGPSATNDQFFGGTISGVQLPLYQSDFVNAANMGSGMYRNFPDVSMLAANVTLVYTSASGTSGTVQALQGTSISAPLWAAFTALVNQQAQTASVKTVGFANPILYGIAGTSVALYDACFNDITTGFNTPIGTTTPPVNGFPAVTGYDLATGLGSPTCGLIRQLSSPTPTVPVTCPASVTMCGLVCCPSNVCVANVCSPPPTFNLTVSAAAETTEGADLCIDGTGYTPGALATIVVSGVPDGAGGNSGTYTGGTQRVDSGGGYPPRAVMRRRAGCNWTPAPPRGLRSVPREAQLVG